MGSKEFLPAIQVFSSQAFLACLVAIREHATRESPELLKAVWDFVCHASPEFCTLIEKTESKAFQTFLKQIKETSSWESPEFRQAIQLYRSQETVGKTVQHCFETLKVEHARTLEKIDALLEERIRPDTNVHWLVQAKHPFDDVSQTFWRFIAWRLMVVAEGAKAREKGLLLKTVFSAGDVTVSSIKGGRYLVEYGKEGRKTIVCHQALLRWGAQKDRPKVEEPKDQVPKAEVMERRAPAVLASVARVFEIHSSELLNQVVKKLDRTRTHEKCNQPWGWNDDKDFRRDIGAKYPGNGRAPAAPKLRAEFIAGFHAPRPDLDAPDQAPWVFRIRIWLEGLAGPLWVRYDLHPEEDNTPRTRVGIGPSYEQWLNTRNNYTIRVRSSDGFEWRYRGVLRALKRQRSALAKAGGADRQANDGVQILPVPTTTTNKPADQLESADKPKQLNFDEAISIIKKTDKYNQAEGVFQVEPTVAADGADLASYRVVKFA
jgi:hypothetical protein